MDRSSLSLQDVHFSGERQHYWRRTFTVFALAMLFSTIASYRNVALASATPLVIVPCINCEDLTSLKSSVTSYFLSHVGQALPGYVGTLSASASCSDNIGGTLFFAVSTTQAISGTFWICLQQASLWNFSFIANSSNANSNAETIVADSLLFARSAGKDNPINVPDTLTPSSTPELIGRYLQDIATPQVGPSEINFWHGLTNYPQAIHGTFLNTQTGQTFQLWNGDTLTVTFSNGWTVKAKWTPLSSVQWFVIADTVRDENGNIPATAASPAQSTSSGSSGGAAGSINLGMPSGPAFLLIPYSGAPSGTVTIIQLPGVSLPSGGGSRTFSDFNIKHH